MNATRPAPLRSERALLGALVQHCALYGDVSPIVSAGDFHRLEHGALFELIGAMVQAGKAVDMVSLPEAIIATGQQDRFGGVTYAVGLSDDCPSPSAWRTYAEEVRRASDARKLMGIAEQMLEAAAATGDVEALVREAGAVLMAADGGVSFASQSDSVNAFEDDLFRRAKMGEGAGRIPTGWESTDEYFNGGLKPEEGFVFLAATPSTGKSAVMSCMARRMAEAGVKVGVISMEMSTQGQQERILSDMASIPYSRVQDPARMSDGDWDRYTRARDRWEALPIEWCDTPKMTPEQICSVMRRWVAQGVEAIFIDHLAEVRLPRKGRADLEIGDAASEIRATAQKLKVPCVLLHQLNREATKGEPSAAHLRGSGDLEALADVIIILRRPGRDDEKVPDNVITFHILKNRCGSCGTLDMGWEGSLQRVSELGVISLDKARP